MIDFELYSENTGWVKETVSRVIAKYGGFLRWNGQKETILDVGCGDGSLTTNILQKLISNNSSGATLTAVDIDENLIKHAKKKYEYSDVTFDVMDITSEEDTNKYTNSVDKVFSFFCLHWCPDLTICFKNIHKMLKIGGSTFHIILCKNTTMSVIYHEMISPRWKTYVKREWKDMMAGPLLQRDDTETWMNAILKDCMLDVTVCKVIRDEYTFADFQKLKGFILAFPSMYEDIPEELRDDLFEELKMTIENERKSLTFPIDCLLAIASK